MKLLGVSLVRNSVKSYPNSKDSVTQGSLETFWWTRYKELAGKPTRYKGKVKVLHQCSHYGRWALPGLDRTKRMAWNHKQLKEWKIEHLWWVLVSLRLAVEMLEKLQTRSNCWDRLNLPRVKEWCWMMHLETGSLLVPLQPRGVPLSSHMGREELGARWGSRDPNPISTKQECLEQESGSVSSLGSLDGRCMAPADGSFWSLGCICLLVSHPRSKLLSCRAESIGLSEQPSSACFISWPRSGTWSSTVNPSVGEMSVGKQVFPEQLRTQGVSGSWKRGRHRGRREEWQPSGTVSAPVLPRCFWCHILISNPHFVD